MVERKTLNLVVVGSSPTMGAEYAKFLFARLKIVLFCAATQTINSVVGLVVRISAFQADGPGSIPGQRTQSKNSKLFYYCPQKRNCMLRFVGLVAMTPASHAGGRRFDPATKYFCCQRAIGIKLQQSLYIYVAVWSSGMILRLGRRGRRFESANGPCMSCIY